MPTEAYARRVPHLTEKGYITLPGNLCFKIGITGQGFCSCKFSGLFQLKGPFFFADIHSKLFARVIATYSNLNSSAFFK